MPRINDETLYPISPLEDGSTWIGSLANGKTVQYSSEGMLEFIKKNGDVVMFQNATRKGQLVVGNLENNPESDAPGYNNGGTFLAEVMEFPILANTSTYIRYILKIR